MENIFNSIKLCAIKIKEIINRDDFGYSDSNNSSGDNQLKIDIESDIIIENIFKNLTEIKAISSEEKDEVVEINPNGDYLISYDPLDGSSLIDVNLSVGSIFGIYEKEFLPNHLIASAYIVYGPRTELVTVIKGEKPKLFRLNNQNKFYFVQNIQLKEKGKINASGGTQKNWYPHHKNLIESLFNDNYRLRYSGGMVPDLHQILLKQGGLFSYPATTDKKRGKLRLLFEILPFALIFESAGGFAIDENLIRLLDVIPNSLHDTSSCFFGSKFEIEKVKKFYD